MESYCQHAVRLSAGGCGCWTWHSSTGAASVANAELFANRNSYANLDDGIDSATAPRLFVLGFSISVSQRARFSEMTLQSSELR
jgi:hypothetical protein